ASGVAGGQDHSGRITRLAELLRNLEPVDVGKLDVQQHQLRPQPLRLGDSRPTVSRFAHDLDAIRLQQPPGNRAEPDVVVDDQNGQRHRTSVPRRPKARTRANPDLGLSHADSHPSDHAALVSGLVDVTLNQTRHYGSRRAARTGAYMRALMV